MVFAEALLKAGNFRPNLTQYEILLPRAGRLTPPVEEAVDRAYSVRTENQPDCSLLRRYSTIAYIAGALTGMTEETKARYKDLSDILADGGVFGYAPHVFGTDPKKHPQVTAQEVRDMDYLWAVVMPEFHFNWLDPLAQGNAIEEGWAESFGIPSVYLMPEGQKFSRLTLGMDNIDHEIRYKNFEDAIAQAGDYAARIVEFRKEGSKVINLFREINGLAEEPKIERELHLFDLDTGRIGKVKFHDWVEGGTYGVRFPDGSWKEYHDRNPHFRPEVRDRRDVNYILIPVPKGQAPNILAA
ncbi:hypothetical protein CL619_05210 [archaeon]|nr:hypothetical protein [archaeon]|tara:strand:- start:3604 stop:4500 length:897 start_codon:yes stop_codon:yes gene_type:complete